MCVIPNTPEYEICVAELATATRQIGTGHPMAITWLIRGGCLQNLGDLKGAIRDYRRALAQGIELTNEELAQVYDSLARSRVRLGDYAGAVADSKKAVGLNTRQARYHTNLGHHYYWVGDYAGCIYELNHALLLAPEEHWAVGYRAACYQKLGQHPEAIADYSRMLALGPDGSYHLLVNRARSYMALEQYLEACADCDEAAHRASQEDYQIYLIRGYSQYRLGRLDKALADLSRAIKLRPALGELHLWRGLVFRAFGDERAATDELVEFTRGHREGLSVALQEAVQAMTIGVPMAPSLV